MMNGFVSKCQSKEKVIVLGLLVRIVDELRKLLLIIFLQDQINKVYFVFDLDRYLQVSRVFDHEGYISFQLALLIFYKQLLEVLKMVTKFLEQLFFSNILFFFWLYPCGVQ